MNEETGKQYIEITEKLLNRYQRIADCDWRSDVFGFCEWLIHESDQWAKSTWRLRRSAVVYFFNMNGPVEAARIVQSANKRKKVDNTTKNTSQKKSKKISINEVGQLVDHLKNGSSRYDLISAHWLMAGFFAGARPCEWFGAKQLGNNSIELRNAKFNEIRSCGESRILHFSPMATDDHKSVIFDFIHEVNSTCKTKSEFNDLYNACRQRIYLANKHIWPYRKKTICLYTPRHQFSANCKKTLNHKSVAALMGHRSAQTATEHYLNSHHGDTSLVILEPDQKNIELVEVDYEENPFFKNHKKTKKNKGD